MSQNIVLPLVLLYFTTATLESGRSVILIELSQLVLLLMMKFKVVANRLGILFLSMVERVVLCTSTFAITLIQ